MALAILALFAPIAQSNFNLLKLYKLAGDNVVANDTSLTISNYLSGDFQRKKDDQLASNFGFRSLLIKINNQINFSCFNMVNAQGVIAGKENYLFETTYIDAFNGKDYMGLDNINDYLNRLEIISNKLLKLNKQIILVIAPSKPSFYREFLPKLQKHNISNYEVISCELKKRSILKIDFSNWFNKTKHQSKYPLYPKHGNHWSMYGSFLAADSIINYIESLRAIDLPNLQLKKITLEQPKNEDKDIEYGINLLVKLPSFDLATPTVETESMFGKAKTNVLFIGDSFFWNIYNLGILKSFQKSSFWYYNQAVYPMSYIKQTSVKDLSINDEINQQDVIIILATESNISSFGWGFLDVAENYLNTTN